MQNGVLAIPDVWDLISPGKCGLRQIVIEVARWSSNAFENVFLGTKLSEYHTGYRAFSRALLERLPLEANSDDFVFDNQVLAQVISLGCAIGEVSCPARYLPEASSINFRRSVRYGLGCLATALRFRLARCGFLRPIA